MKFSTSIAVLSTGLGLSSAAPQVLQKRDDNLRIIDVLDIADYEHSTVFENEASAPQNCVCWNTYGPDGRPTGFFKGNEALSFTVPGNGVVAMAVDPNSLGGCTCAVGTIPTTEFGQWASTYYEFAFGDARNGGWSGADASCLVAAAYDLPIPGLNVCSAGYCSTIYPGGTGDNAYTPGTELEVGLGIQGQPGLWHVAVFLGTT